MARTDWPKWNVEPGDALDLVNDEEGWMRDAYADGQSAGNIALDLLARI